VTEAQSGEVLNLQGGSRGDGRPDTAIHPSDSRPLVTWAYGSGDDHDVALAEWADDGWSEIAFLTSSTDDELDPRAYFDAEGRAYVVWWSAGAVEKLFLARREPGSTDWGLPEVITHSGRRPSVCRVQEGLLLAFERDRDGGGQQIVLVSLLLDGTSSVQVVAETDRADPLDVVVHFHADTLWMDRTHGAGEFAYAVHGADGWSVPATLPWDDKSWIGEEEARKVVRGQVLASRF